MKTVWIIMVSHQTFAKQLLLMTDCYYSVRTSCSVNIQALPTIVLLLSMNAIMCTRVIYTVYISNGEAWL